MALNGCSEGRKIVCWLVGAGCDHDLVHINIDGHDIEIVSNSEIPPEAREPVKFNIENGKVFGAQLPAHPTKSTLFKFRLEGTNLPDNEYLILQPPAAKRDHGVNMAEMRPKRVPEPSMADYEHQMRLFSVVGSVTVAGGHVEMAMKKVLVSLRDEHRNLMDPKIPGDWDGLEKELRKLCDTSSDIRMRLSEILDGADRDQLRNERNDVIHGYWWTVAAHDRLINARYYRPRSGQQPVRIQTSLQAVQDLATKLFNFAAQLDALVTPDWPIAIFTNKEATQRRAARE